MRHRSRVTSRKGYALVLTALASAGIGSVLAVMLERQITQRLAVSRQVEAYQRHHAAKGYQELIDSWLRSITGQTLGSMIADGDKVLTLDLGSGATAEVYFADAQGAVLASASGLSGRDFADAVAMRAALPTGARDPALPPLTREVGPLAVSMRSAPTEVLEAAFTAVAGLDGAREFAQRIIAIRAEQPVQQADVAKIAIALGVSAEARTRLNEVLVADPALWFVKVEIRRGTSGNLIASEGGHIVVSARRPGRGGSTGGIWEKSSAFLTWRKLPIQ